MPLKIVGKLINRVEERILARIIKQRILIKQGRSIIGPVLPRLAFNGTSNSHGLQEKRSHISCVSCGSEVSLGQEVFCTYGGPAKCFSCGAALGLNMESGTFEINDPISPLFNMPIGHNSQGSVIG
ncbi:MAG: hypothetical protein JW896_02100 [Deltaproteobacteria bacterium]|nr:hypothetical protein [Deltaproteobacteria bacterium]